MALNVTTVVLQPGYRRAIADPSVAQWDQGQILKIEGIELPFSYQVEFCCQGDTTTITQIGGADGVSIPDSLLQTGRTIVGYLVLHQGADDRETEYWIDIFVKARPQPPEITPTPEEQDTIDELITALNEGVEAAEGSATLAESYAKGGTGTRTGEDTDNAKYYAEQAAEAKDSAVEAQQAIENMTATASGLPAGSSPTVTKTEVGGVVNLAFGIPKGDKGDKGNTGDAATVAVGQTTTGSPGSDAAVTNSGDIHNAVLNFAIPRGNTGATGNGIASIVKTATSGLVDTYTVTYTNGNVTTFTVTNGEDGADGVVQSVNGKSASEITLDAGDIGYDDSETYGSDTVGKGLNDLKAAITNLGLSVVSGKLCVTYNT